MVHLLLINVAFTGEYLIAESTNENNALDDQVFKMYTDGYDINEPNCVAFSYFMNVTNIGGVKLLLRLVVENASDVTFDFNKIWPILETPKTQWRTQRIEIQKANLPLYSSFSYRVMLFIFYKMFVIKYIYF